MRAPGERRTALADLFDPVAVGGLIDDMCARLVTHERTAVGFSLFHDVADALLAPLVSELMLESDELRVTDPGRTRLILGSAGSLVPVRLCTVALDAPRAWGPIALGGWSALNLDAAVGAFSPHVRIRRPAFAAAAGFVLAQRAEQWGHRLGQVRRARRQARALALAAGSAIELAPYLGVLLDHGAAWVPQRTVCCRRYRITASAEFCVGCPREPEPTRSLRLRSQMSLHAVREKDFRPDQRNRV